MSDNRSDYSLPYVDVHNALPVILQNPLLKAVSDTTFNRFLTKPELSRVIGTVGTPSASTKKDLIEESNTYDQAFQLQPVIVDSTKSSTNIITYKDVQRIGERLGINFDNPKDWQTTERFNFCPPINIDKLINFREYFWVDTELSPQYITIANQYISLQAQLSQMVQNYLIQPTNSDKVKLWPKIQQQLDLVHTVVPASHKLVIPNISVVVQDLQHAPYVPQILPVDINKYAPQSDWATQNMWVHRNDLDDATSASVATLPIIEYHDTVVMTKWTFTKHLWQYRISAAFDFEDVEFGPSSLELSSTPATTSRGDKWLGFSQHWSYRGAELPVPTTARPPSSEVADVLVATAGQTIFSTTKKILVGKNILRVYVDGIRQYGSYSEVDMNTIQFYDPVNTGSVVQIFTQVVTASDIGKDNSTILGLNLVEYRIEEQYKHADNDYPHFDLVDTNGVPLHKSSPIFMFSEDVSYSIHPILGRRVVFDPLTRDYGFTIGLIGDNNVLYQYIDTKKGLASVWAKNTTGEKYSPSKVDATRVPSNSKDAVWEIPQQFMYNIHHECRTSLKFSEVFAHFQSILDAQKLTTAEQDVYGAINKNAYRLNSNLNYGIGGTINEYNDNFANFVSALISSDYSPLDVIDFARSQYEAKLSDVRKQVESALIGVLTSTDTEVQQDIPAAITKIVLRNMAQDANQSVLYNDSSPSSNFAVQNWIATLPYIGMVTPVAPYVLRDTKLGIVRFTHHDGHTRAPEVDFASVVLKALMATLVPSPTAPVSPKLGDLWYNNTTDSVSRYDNTNWVLVDVTNIVLAVLLSIETSLYKGVPTSTVIKYDIDALEQAYPNRFNELLRLEFESHCNNNNIKDPYRATFDITDPFTWNYSKVDVSGTDFNKNRLLGINILSNNNLVSKWTARWEDLYTNVYGTSMPHLEPWKLQGYAVIPDWWNASYKSTTRRWSYQMWKNILNGTIPAGKMLPNGVISTGVVNSVLAVPVTSVNIRDITIGGYAPDDLLPPYWPYDSRDPNEPTQMIQGMLISGLDYNAAKVSENLYPFGKKGPIEQDWRNSIGYNYARMKIAFKLDPVRFLNDTFGEEYTKVQGLQICNRTQTVLSHHDVVFHGDTDNLGTAQSFAGLNQWYVQLFRYVAAYGSGSTIQRVWTEWNTQLAYNVGGFMVDNTLSVTSPRVDIAPTDYNVQIKTARKVRDLWIDALYVTVEQAGAYRELPQGAGRDWQFKIGVHSPVVRDLQFYKVKKYRVSVDVASNTFSILDNITLREAGWNNGISIMLDTGVNGILPSTIDDSTYYSIIPKPILGGMVGDIDTNRFSIALSADDAKNGIAINLSDAGGGIMYVAELASTFYAMEARNTTTLWKHYAINKNDVGTFSSSLSITGVQNMIDFIDGYVAQLMDKGFVFNDSSVPEYDENDRLVNWQYETEAMINHLYLQLGNIASFTTNSVAYQVGEIEINPFRNNLWLDHPTGVVSEFTNVLNSNTQAFAYSRDGYKYTPQNFHVIRQDTRTQFSTLIVDDAILQTNGTNHTYDVDSAIAGIYMFFDEYEHLILFQPRTLSGDYIYDQFLGITVPWVNLYFEKQLNSTKRPNVGGFVLQDGGLTQNFEYTVGNIQKYYDTFTVNENASFVNHARSMLGYKPNASYFQGSNVTPKSQFLFYKGMIKAKGTLASVEAFTSSNQSETTKVDEFFAYKAFEFGDNRSKISYTIKLRENDTATGLLKFQFVDTPTTIGDPMFTKIAVSDTTRWENYPSQMNYLPSIEKLFGMTPTALLSADKQIVPIVDKVPYKRFRIISGNININGETKSRKLLVHDQSVEVSVMWIDNIGHKRSTSPATITNAVISLQPFVYIPGVNEIDVYVNGAHTTEFTETSVNTIKLNTPVNGVVVVVRKPGILVENVHYIRHNNRMIELISGTTNGIQILTYKADYSDCVPVKLYDQKSKTVVADIAPWDPLNGYDNAILTQCVDISDDRDIATYNVTPDSNNSSINIWDSTKVGTVWKDTGSYSYVPYSDIGISNNEQLANWATLSDWSDAAIYQWVESTVTPSNWAMDNGTPRNEVYGRYRTVHIIDKVDVDKSELSIIGNNEFAIDDEVVLFGESLPAPLSIETIYTISTITGSTIVLADRAGELVPLTDAGEGSIRIAKAAYDTAWTKIEQKVVQCEMLDVDFNSNTIKVPSLFEKDEVTIFANGKYLQDGFVIKSVDKQLIVELDVDIMTPYTNTAHLYQLTVLVKSGVLDGLPSTPPANMDLLETSAQFFTSYPYSVVDRINSDGSQLQPLYYFWVRGLVEGNTKPIAMRYAEYLISTNDSPFLVAMHPTMIDGNMYLDKLIISGVFGKVTDDDRYVLRLSKNSTLRDRVFNTAGELLNPVHSQWIMFREDQPNNIDQALWNKVIESLVGHNLLDPTQSVPALDRMIYDAQHGTYTRFGLNNDQSFVDGQRALDTILTHLNSATITYKGFDIDAFLIRNKFDTKTNILNSMKAIYLTFPAKYVNMLFFAVLNDALSNHKVDYSAGLMKTSMVALSGSYKLNVNGAYNE